MFKRLFWLLVGVALGFGTSLWVARFVRATLGRYSPERVSDDVAATLRHLAGELRAAVAEGRAGMREAEERLRAELEPRRPPR